MNVFVTGATGFVGNRLVKALAETGVNVYALEHLHHNGNQLNSNPNIHVVRGDILNPETYRDILKKCDRIYHLAAFVNDWASDKTLFFRINVKASMQLFIEAQKAGIKKIVFVSTAGTIGPPDQKNIKEVDETNLRLVDFFFPYESSKMVAEEQIQHLVRNGHNIVIVNPTKIFGPGKISRSNSNSILIKRYAFDSYAYIPATRNKIINLVYVDDVVQGIMKAMEIGKAGEKYLLAGENSSYEDIVVKLKKITGRNIPVIRFPIFLLKIAAYTFEFFTFSFRIPPVFIRGTVRKLTFSWPVSNAKARKELGFEPRSLEKGITETIEWLRNNKE